MSEHQPLSGWRRLLEHARRRPAVAWVGGVASVLAVALILGLINRQPPAPVAVPPATAPDPLANAGAATPAAPAALAPATPAAPAVQPLALRPAAYPLDAPLKPGAIETLEIDSSGRMYSSGAEASWVEVASRRDEAPPTLAMVEFSRAARAYAGIGWPNSYALARLSREGYFKVEESGIYALIVTARSSGIACAAGLPTADAPLVEVEGEPGDTAILQAGQVGLAAGWHRVQLRCLGRGKRNPKGSGELAMRPPGGVPVVVALHMPDMSVSQDSPLDSDTAAKANPPSDIVDSDDE